MFSKRTITVALGALAVAACNTVDPKTGSADRQFGEAVAWNKAVQTINPDPVYAADALQPGSDGAKARAATERYRKDQVKQVEQMSTSSSSSSSGGGSGPQ